MIEIKHTGAESWFNASFAKVLSARLSDRLWKRCEGRRGLFVTLTYRRDEYDGPRDLYRRASEEQHVALFLRKVARVLDEDLKGRWFCKLEFQAGGWVHWHLIIVGVERIPHDVCAELWGRGHVWLRRLSKRNVRYCTKYVVKAGGLPAWLLLERPRGVKVVRVSPGFWGDPPRPEREEEEEEGWGDVPPLRDVYVPVGEVVVRDRHLLVARDACGVYRRERVDLGPLLFALLRAGCSVVGRRGRWLMVDATMGEFDRAVAVVGAAERASARPPRLHLRRTGNPDSEPLPSWIDAWFREEAELEVAA